MSDPNEVILVQLRVTDAEYTVSQKRLDDDFRRLREECQRLNVQMERSRDGQDQVFDIWGRREDVNEAKKHLSPDGAIPS